MPLSSLSRHTKRLCIVIGLPLLALGPLALFAYAGFSVLNADARDAEHVRLARLQRLSALEADVTRATLRLQQAALADPPAETAATLGSLAADRKRIAEAAAPAPDPTGPPAAERFGHLERLPPLLARFKEHHGAAVQLVQLERRAEASALVAEKAAPAADALLAELASAVRFEQYRMKDDLRQIARSASSTLYLLVSLVLFTMAGSMLFADRFLLLLETLRVTGDALARATASARARP
jgi:hypothetical protein